MTAPDGSGTGGSYGGEGGADTFDQSPSQAYGSLMVPSHFGSGGGDSSTGQQGKEDEEAEVVVITVQGKRNEETVIVRTVQHFRVRGMRRQWWWGQFNRPAR